MAGGPEGAKRFATETVNKIKKSNQEAKNSVKDYPDQEKNKLQALAGSVQKDIEGDGRVNAKQRSERGSLKITGERGVYKLGSYDKTTSIQKVGSDYKVLGQLFDKPEEAIKYANLFNFMKREVTKHGGLKGIGNSSSYQNGAKIYEKSLLKYGDGEKITIFDSSSMPDSKNDGMLDMGKDENRLQQNLVTYLIKFAQNTNLIKS